MTPLHEFAEHFQRWSKLDLIRALWRLSRSFESVCMVGMNQDKRARVARAILEQVTEKPESSGE